VLCVFFALVCVDGRLIHPKFEKSGFEKLNALSSGASKAPQFCDNPVAKQRVVFPTNITGRAKIEDVPMWSGYVNVTPSQWLFYWLFETRDAAPDAPLIIWTNGGPGCTSMEGATTELGPMVLFDIKEACSSAQCDFTFQMSTNPYAWNAHANVLFLDQPRTVGYSFGTAGPTVHSSVDAAKDFITFYQNFLGLFPQFVGRPLIIGGESYGGMHLLALIVVDMMILFS
jgi:carboxypeptidase C (cathepsin A)